MMYPFEPESNFEPSYGKEAASEPRDVPVNPTRARSGVYAYMQTRGGDSRVRVPRGRYEAVLSVIGEREFQADLFPGIADKVVELERELLLIEEYARKARRSLLNIAATKAGTNEGNSLESFRIIAALALRALEHHGPSEREGYELI